MREGGPTPEEMGLKPEEILINPETQTTPDAELETLFAEGKMDTFFEQALDYATTSPQNFCRFYKKFFVEKFPGKVLSEVPDDRLFVLSFIAHIEGRPDFENQKEQLLKQIKETKEFGGLMEQRKRVAQENGKKILEELQVQKSGDCLPKQEIEKMTKNLQSNIEDPAILNLLTSYYLYAQGEFAMPNSLDGKAAREQDTEYNNRQNKRTNDIRENPEELKRVLDMLSDKVRATVEKSNDPNITAATNQDNLIAPPICIIAEGDFLHGAPISTLDQVRKIGFLCREVINPDYAKSSMSLNWGGTISFGRQTKSEITGTNRTRTDYANPLLKYLNRNSFLGKYRGNIASEYGAHDGNFRHYLRTGERVAAKTKEQELEDRRKKLFDIKTAGDDAITYILREQKNSYELKAGTATSHSDEHGVGIGVPSTEIKGIVVDASSEAAIKKVFSELCKYPFFVPVYDSETGTLVNEDMKKLYK